MSIRVTVDYSQFSDKELVECRKWFGLKDGERMEIVGIIDNA